MNYVVTAAEMRELDAATIDGIGIPGVVLMENAGRGIAAAMRQELDGVAAPEVAIVCGAGNNGGDGYVVGRVLREHEVGVTVYLAAERGKVHGDAAIHLGAYERAGGRVVSIADAAALAANQRAIASADAVVDAVFGTGLARDVAGHYRDVVEVINAARGRVIAVDIPSGLGADSGVPLGVAVRADRTVTMAFLKVALAVSPGFARAGRVSVVEIGIPRALAGDRGVKLALLEATDVAAKLPAPSPLDHKNRRGHVVCVAGSPGKRGAGRMTAWAALRSGAGLVTLASGWVGGEVWAPDPVMTAELDPEAAGAAAALGGLASRLRARAIAVGPGMPTSDGGRKFVFEMLSAIDLPMVVDADALNHLGTDLERLAAAAAPIVITPHPGEAARLLGSSVAEVEGDRVAACRELAARARQVVVLKGARTLVCDGRAGDEFVTINPTGNAGLATAGSGDVLTGVIAALLAQGLSPGDAARLGVYLHGLAGDLARDDLGEWGMTASDVAEAMPAALRRLATQIAQA